MARPGSASTILEDALKIACIAWGSLIWEPAPLELASPWRPGGPPLPLEFVRDSDDSDELALVLHPAAPLQPTWWAWLAAADIEAAREMLRRREKIRPQYPQWVGSLPHLDPSVHAQEEQRVAAWMRAMGIQAAVWTALPAKFAGVSERAPSAHEALALLDGMAGEQRANAERYVRRIPREIDTLYRRLFADKLGWTPAPVQSADGAAE